MVDSREYIIAMIVDQGHKDSIYTRPGQITYNDEMYMVNADGTPHISSALTSYRIPQFEQEGIGFIEAAKRRARSRFDTEMQYAINNIPKSIFSNNMGFK
jgi:flagellar basal body rod protein FlgG